MPRGQLLRRRERFVVRRFAGPSVFVEQLAGLRIAHLTDLHVGRVTPLQVQFEAAERTNAAEPDAVMITGDFVNHSQLHLDELSEVMRAYRAPVFAVLGNHDHWSGADSVRAALRRSGVEVLDNAHTSIELRHQRLQVVGLDDAYTGHADIAKATKGLRADLPTIGLSHIGEEADALWAQGVPLVLSGHTHAGQVTVAKIHEVALGKLFGHRYIHGLYGSRRSSPEAKGALYVGAGVGAAVVTLRVGERSQRELALFELGEAPGAFEEHHEEQEPHPDGRPPTPAQKAKRREKVERLRAKRAEKTARTEATEATEAE